MKICSSCKIEKSLDEFYKKSNSDKPREKCKACYYPAKNKICGYCESHWIASSGQGKRNNTLCDECYVFYRRAVTLYHAAKNRARKNFLEFDLEVADIVKALRKPCSKTGIHFDLTPNGNDYTDRKPFSPSLDKIDPRKGYTKDNIQCVCWIYNLAKGRNTDKDVLEFCQKVVHFYDTQIVKNAGAQMQLESTQTAMVCVSPVENISNN